MASITCASRSVASLRIAVPRALARAARRAQARTMSTAPTGQAGASAAQPAAGTAAGSTPKRVNLRMERDGVAVVELDSPGEKVNTLGKALMAEMEPVLQRLETDPAIRAVVLMAAPGKDSFIAGADITMFDECATPAQLTRLSADGQRFMGRIAALRVPVVAAIHGQALGGGLELALATTYRIATRAKATQLGVPEVQLGLLPGAGGTQRLHTAVGIQEALTLMTTGKKLSAERALRAGLVHELTEPAALVATAVQAASELAKGTLAPPKRRVGLLLRLLEGNPVGRHVLFSQAEAAIRKAAGGHYPAPPAILAVLKTGVDQGMQAGLAAEADAFGKLGFTPQSRALRGLFFAQTAARKNPFGPPPIDVAGARVGVLGAGLMGAGIATISADTAGLRVVMKDRDAAAVARGEAAVAANLAGRVKRKALSQFDADRIASRVLGVSDADATWRRHLGGSDVVIEAVFEDLAVKHAVAQAVQPLLPPHGVFATNTSAIPIGRIAAGAPRPERLLGMHYFSPADKMPLLEVIPHEGTAPDAAALAVSLGQKQGKTVIVVKDVPGFYVNRCLGPFMSEGFGLVQSGVEPAALDAALTAFGFPVGPIRLADEVGLDVAYHTHTTLAGALGDRMAGSDPAGVKALVDAGLLGRKTGKGFYVWGKDAKGSGPRPVNPEVAPILRRHPVAAPTGPGAAALTQPAALAERMVLRFAKECVISLQDGVIRSAADGDLGAVFGIGFPPFLGGPFRWLDTLGAAAAVEKLRRYEAALGPHFAPPQLLVDMAATGRKFHA